MTEGKGKIAPRDTDDFIEIVLTAGDTEVLSAQFTCSPSPVTELCCRVLCEVLPGKPWRDIPQTTANLIIYNTDEVIPSAELYKATMAVSAAKRAAADIAGKLGVTLDTPVCNCGS